MAKQVTVQDSITVYPSGLSSANSSYSSINSNYPITNAYDSSSSTNYAYITCRTGSRATTYVSLTFDVSAVPANATIDSITCSAKLRVSSTSYLSTAVAQLYNGTTAKGSSVSARTTTATVYNLTPGNWTRSELNNIQIRYTGTRGTSNTNSAAYLYFYGADLTVNYSINGMQYTITAASSDVGAIATPATQDLLSGETGTVRIDCEDINDYTVTDNDTDVTNSLVRYATSMEPVTDTFIPSSFDSTNSVYSTTAGDSNNGIYSTNYIENGLTNATSTTRAALYSVQGSGSISKMYYNFNCSSIPNNATITNVTCQFKGGTQGTTYYSNYIAQLTTGTTLKGSSVSVTGTNTSPTTVTINGGTNWTRAELNNIKILFQVTRGTSNTTTDSTWSFYGATLSVTYTTPVENEYYWIYTIPNISEDHVILIETAGVYIPPEEDPQYEYQSLTISSINATTNPGTGTTRVIEGSNQTITISPTDPQLTLALDNGVSKSASVARLNMDFESSCIVTIQYINYAESGYDYGMFGKLDTAVATDGLTASNNTSTPSDSTSNYQLAMASNSSNAQTISYTVPAGEHFIDIKYGKDDATDSNNDTLQWKVLSVEATSAGGDYTYTLTNITEKHSLVFVFGNVNYYFITSSGTNCRLFPDGQQVKLEGDSYKINIIPENLTDEVVLTDNNTEQVLVKEEGVDKNNNPIVSYNYTITNIQAAHTLVVTSTQVTTNKLFIKSQGSWVQVTKIYLKQNDRWVEQDITYISDNNITNLRKL